jgi:hypothetical protein
MQKGATFSSFTTFFAVIKHTVLSVSVGTVCSVTDSVFSVFFTVKFSMREIAFFFVLAKTFGIKLAHDWSNIHKHIIASVFHGTPCTETSSSAVLIHCHGLTT